MTTRPYASPSVIAGRWSFVRELGGENAGAWVNFFQRFTGNTEGESWCCSFACTCLDVATKGHSPYKKSGACQDLYLQAIAAGHVLAANETPQRDDIFFYVYKANGRAHHIGFVESVGFDGVIGIAGNTSSSGQDTDGEGVHSHRVVPPSDSIVVYVRPWR
jgi:hypothetical protein